jgi:hypothetical protein
MLGMSKPIETTSVALEVRIPTGKERVYTNIIERLYEKVEDGELIIPNKLGKFFPYHMKSKMPDVFTYLMRQQNAVMKNSAVIPIFGYTPSARKQQINLEGEETTLELALAATKEIIRIEATPSTQHLHKYLIVVHTEDKGKVFKIIQEIFGKIIGPLKNQPTNFPTPRCGGRERPMEQSNVSEKQVQMTSYMASLETFASAHNPQDAGPSEPPKRHRKITISYAGAVKIGILKEPTITSKPNTTTNTQKPTQEYHTNTQDTEDIFTTQRQVSWDSNTTDTGRSTGSSLSRSITNSKMLNLKKDIDVEIRDMKGKLENRMDQQDQRISELLQLKHTMNNNLENKMAQAVILALVKEKTKVQELTHGRVYEPSEAPLADANGILPFGAKAQSGGPLDRLHHVEVTVQHMASVLDNIADHLQKDTAARHLFNEDENSETSTILETDQTHCRNEVINKQRISNEDVEMTTPREHGGIRLQGSGIHPSHETNTPTRNDTALIQYTDGTIPKSILREPRPKRNHTSSRTKSTSTTDHDPDNPSSPQRTPPPKRERPDKTPSAIPDGTARERGET